ncbi:MAG: peptidylprolyl isomerase [Aliarcobacter sp.]|jgi:peptidyl-prolyl cis-trans isomerase C|nr:peptidylprolyl isomerase [Aliarcobacter sp.]MDX9900497.1 peptidylprolyl isomerase [Aliarcobacter sp.]
MKRIVTSLVASIVLVTVLNANDYGSVDGDAITKQDIAMVLQDPRIDFDKLPDPSKKQVIEQIVNKKLIAKNAIKNGIEKDPQYVEAMSGIKEDLALQVWQKNEVDKLKFTDQDKKDFFEKNKDKFVMPEILESRHILVKTEAEAKAIIIELDKSAKKEDKFAELAKTKSADATAQNGGYLGKVPADKLVPEFTAAAKALAKNTYSKTPVKTEFGYHIIFLKDKTAPKALTYAEVEPKISQILIGNAFSKKIKELTDELKKDAKIVIK